MNKDEIAKAIVTDPKIQQRMAKHIALKCFRNSVLEDLHSGKVPNSKTGDYSDVIVHCCRRPKTDPGVLLALPKYWAGKHQGDHYGNVGKNSTHASTRQGVVA